MKQFSRQAIFPSLRLVANNAFYDGWVFCKFINSIIINLCLNAITFAAEFL
ncbi:hypothetical protein MED193_06304 [Roseobacter sp. MED193]|nr:hypothetical protein MED193_06304 [Roseobacter sp. MED193]